MIDYEKSAKLNGVGVEELKLWFEKYPNSVKRIIRICDGCGEERNIPFQGYSDLCHKCSTSIPEALTANSKRQIKYHKDNPEARKAHSKRMIQYYIDNPEAVENARLSSIEQWADQSIRNAQSERLIQYRIDNPDVGREQSEQMKNSEAAKASQEKQRGGNDIVKHHFIYDHNNPNQHTVDIMRSQHMSHHLWMRRNGLKVPHFNVTKENKDIFKKRKYNGIRH